MKRGPKAQVYSVAEVARLMELPERLVRARARLSFFPGATRHPTVPDEWVIPGSAVESALRVKVEPHFSIQTAARMLDVGYSSLFREVCAVTDLKQPLPPTKSVRALFLFLGRGKPMKRIPESELLRVLGGARAA